MLIWSVRQKEKKMEVVEMETEKTQKEDEALIAETLAGSFGEGRPGTGDDSLGVSPMERLKTEMQNASGEHASSPDTMGRLAHGQAARLVQRPLFPGADSLTIEQVLKERKQTRTIIGKWAKVRSDNQLLASLGIGKVEGRVVSQSGRKCAIRLQEPLKGAGLSSPLKVLEFDIGELLIKTAQEPGELQPGDVTTRKDSEEKLTIIEVSPDVSTARVRDEMGVEKEIDLEYLESATTIAVKKDAEGDGAVSLTPSTKKTPMRTDYKTDSEFRTGWDEAEGEVTKEMKKKIAQEEEIPPAPDIEVSDEGEEFVGEEEEPTPEEPEVSVPVIEEPTGGGSVSDVVRRTLKENEVAPRVIDNIMDAIEMGRAEGSPLANVGVGASRKAADIRKKYVLLQAPPRYVEATEKEWNALQRVYSQLLAGVRDVPDKVAEADKIVDVCNRFLEGYRARKMRGQKLDLVSAYVTAIREGKREEAGELLAKMTSEEREKIPVVVPESELEMRKGVIQKGAYVKECPGHKNSKGEVAPYCVYSHETGKMLSSHKTKAEAETHAKRMKGFGEAKKKGSVRTYSELKKKKLGKG